MALVGIGAMIGLGLGTAASLFLSRVFPGFEALDPVTFGGTAVLFVVVGLCACYVPVLRATRIRAMEALRHE
jgi:ABC-type antimicrobial peptide transport system permease subunit